MAGCSFSVPFNTIISFTAVVRYKSRVPVFDKKPILVHNTHEQPWPLKGYIHGKCPYKVSFPLGPNLWPQFRLREICGEQGLLACGCACNTQSADVRLYLFLFHLSIGMCPLPPQISRALSQYSTVYPFFREGKGSSCSVLTLSTELTFETAHAQIFSSNYLTMYANRCGSFIKPSHLSIWVECELQLGLGLI